MLKDLFNPKVTIFITITIAFQILAMLSSYLDIGSNGLNKNPIKQFILFLIFLVCIGVHYIVVKCVINNNSNIMMFIKGNRVALFILLVFSYIQLLYLISPSNFAIPVEIIGKYLEDHNYNSPWYEAGSYIQTLHRVNGLNTESGYLAAQLLIIFVPFVLASIKNRINIFSPKTAYNPLYFYLLLLSITIILFCAKTTTGLLAILLMLLCLWLTLSWRRKISFSILLLIIGLVFFILATSSSYIMNVVNDFVFNKISSDNQSTINRYGGTIALIVTWMKHFILGVGYGYHDYYLFQNVPTWATTNNEFQNSWLEYKFFPILSIFFGWLTQFGTVCVIFVLVYISKLLKDYRAFSKRIKLVANENYDHKIIDALRDSAHYFFCFYILISMFSFNWSDSAYLIMFFFFVVVRQNLKDIILLNKKDF
ncbi:hypothetical protein COA23_21760 [Priestia megaterium]|nr:hypothetical protein COA23_21760 [Priestia megaterium]